MVVICLEVTTAVEVKIEMLVVCLVVGEIVVVSGGRTVESVGTL